MGAGCDGIGGLVEKPKPIKGFGFSPSGIYIYISAFVRLGFRRQWYQRIH